MTWLEITALSITSLIFFIGLIASLLPVMPGSLIVWLGILIHKIWLGEASVSWTVVSITTVITLIGLTLDWVLGYWGARKFGASWKGAAGALLGGIAGFFIPPPLFWLIAGPIIGAVMGELIAGRSLKAGSRAGIGTIVGSLLAFVTKFGLSVSVVLIFYFKLLL